MTGKQVLERLDKECREEIQRALLEAVANGFMETVGFDKEGRTLYKLTDKGTAEVEAMGEPNRS